MIKLVDNFLISVPKVYDEGEVNGVKLLHANYYVDKEIDRYTRKIRKGIVYSAPFAYSDNNHDPIDPGLPPPRTFIGHDKINEKIQEGLKWDISYYNPSANESFQYVTRAQYGERMTAKDGDEVYFHPSVTEPENFYGLDGENELYICQVHELIFCKGIPQGFYVIVEPHIEDRETSGIIMDSEDQDKLLEGTVKYAHPDSFLKVGQFIYFVEHANYEMIIDGQRCYAMLESEVVLLKNAVS